MIEEIPCKKRRKRGSDERLEDYPGRSYDVLRPFRAPVFALESPQLVGLKKRQGPLLT